jgi:hypothetical protein
MKLRRSIRWISIALLAALVLGEVAVREAGMVDFPIYAVDDEIGYIPQPNQRGCFLNKRCWAFNDRSMSTAAAWNPALHPNILLIGNSIVMGGNPYDQHDKLGPLVQQQLGDDYSVWPIAAGGWTNVNETAYLERQPDILRRANFFVWEFMTGGESQLSTWRGDYVWPREHPRFALWYVLRRYGLPYLFNLKVNELPPVGTINPVDLTKFEATLGKLSGSTGRTEPGILFLYPSEVQLQAARQGHEWLPERPELERISRQYGLKLLDISSYAQWTAAQYSDGTHPTIEGNRILAEILSAAVRESFPPASAGNTPK